MHLVVTGLAVVQRKVEGTQWASGPCRTLTPLTWLSYRYCLQQFSLYKSGWA